MALGFLDDQQPPLVEMRDAIGKSKSQEQAQEGEDRGLNRGSAFVGGFGLLRDVAAHAIAHFEADRHPEK
jgi:hypothetical protein